MSYGLIVKNAQGANILDSSNGSMLLLDMIALNDYAPSGTKSYPDAAGHTVLTQQVYKYSVGGIDSRLHSVSTTYTNGYPTVSWTLLGGSNVGTTLYVFSV